MAKSPDVETITDALRVALSAHNELEAGSASSAAVAHYVALLFFVSA
jgi:hypothetical protein